MTPFRVDEGLPDGVRDRFQWSRFGTPLWLTVGALLLLIVAVGSSRAPDSQARGDAMRAAFGVSLEARATVDRVQALTPPHGSAGAPVEPSQSP